MDLPVAHVEAGLRSGDRTMPEEVNRIVVDQLSDLLFVTEPAGVENLRREGVDAARVHLVGNLMIDSLMRHRERARGRDVRARLGLPPGAHAVLTLHRPATVDVRAALQGVLQAVAGIAAEVRVVFPVHPRTRRRLAEMGLEALLRAPGIVATEPLSYLDFLGLLETARVVLTDSGGIQEEATVLGVPCLTLRESTERPITVSEGTNRIVGTDPEAIAGAWREVLAVGPMAPRRPALWDGRAAARIVDVVEAWRRP
jgi:UDP-N-acetylglucosamine 2-epimerase (non-hydrolysing)